MVADIQIDWTPSIAPYQSYVSLSKISPRQRRAMRLHGWLLMLWASAIGLVTSALLLHGLHVHSMAVRYAIGAGSIYFLGFVVGGRIYVQWWNGPRHLTPDFPTHASTEEEVQYDQAIESKRQRLSQFSWAGDLGSLGDDPLSALLAVIWCITALIALALVAGYLPLMATDLLAGYLAEIVLEFLIGSLLLRRVLKPRPLDDYWGFVVRKTWVAGVFMVLAFAGFGAMVQSINPTAKTVLQALSGS